MEKFSFFTSKPLESNNLIDLICQLCKSLLKDPKSCSECMEANFCAKCAEEALIKNPECPQCHSKWSDKSIKTIPLLMRIYNQTDVKCPNKECSWEGNITLYFQHKESCEKNPVFCSFAKYGCDWSGLQGEEKEHAENCLFKPFKKYFDHIDKKLEESEKNNEFWRTKHAKAEADLCETIGEKRRPRGSLIYSKILRKP